MNLGLVKMRLSFLFVEKEEKELFLKMATRQKKVYEVEITETLKKRILVEAEDADEAWELAWDLHTAQVVELDAGKDDFEAECEVLGEKERDGTVYNRADLEGC